MADKMRVHILAKELNVPSKLIIEKCIAEGISSVKNHMSTLSPGLHATILEWFSEGPHSTAVETAEPIDLKKVRRRRRKETPKPAKESAEAVTTADVGDEAEAEMGQATATAVAEAPREAPVAEPAQPDEAESSDEPADAPVVEAVGEAPAEPAGESAAVAVGEAPGQVDESSDVDEIEEEGSGKEKTKARVRGPVAPAGPQNVPAAAKLSGPRVVRYAAPDTDVAVPRRAPRGGREVSYTGIESGPPPTTDRPDRSGPGRKKGASSKRTGAAKPAEAGERISEWRNRDLEERRERLAGATGRRIHRRRSGQSGGGAGTRMPTGPKTTATVNEPVRLKEFCSQTGINFMQLFKVLKDEHNILANVNMTIPNETAQLLALHFGIELEVVPMKTALDEIKEEFEKRERTNLKPRPTVVAMLGHVDHGKTSLLDAIRKSRVAAGEDGGITQHIRSYHLESSHGAVTFLDTPGHEAFTAMRARGAQITDVVVLVIAADDGVMPQTVEAIRHAQAAKVSIVVALNKIDLGDQNKVKTFGQLSDHGLVPSEWGGETDVIETSATTGRGIKELIDHLADLSSVLELKADPTLPASGTVIEAEIKAGVGAVVQLLVQEGTLRVGDFAVCGNAFGKVRALKDDRGRVLDEAGPSMPVEVWGLDDVPSAGDKLYVVESMQRAKSVATETRRVRVESGRIQTRRMRTLEEMFKRSDREEVPELNVIIKGDVDGSVAALANSLSEIPSDEVRLSIRHAAVGPVNDSDVLLASTSAAIIVAFRVEVPSGARRLAEQHGVDIRPYRVIYECCDDIRKALSGLLTPEERIEERGRAEVRQVFRVSKAGVVAGSYVVNGTIERGHFARVVRDGKIIRDRGRFASLRHFKDDVREVRQGLECGIRLEGFDDMHVGDTVETYEVIKIARSL